MSEEEKLEGKELVEAIKESASEVGQLYPVLVTEDGEVLAGQYRLEADPNWRREVRKDLDTPLKKAQVKFIENLIRRTPSAQEKTQILTEMAEALLKEGFEGNMVQELTRRCGGKRTERWVQKYLPDKYKQMQKAREPLKESDTGDDLALRKDIIEFVKTDPDKRKMKWRDIMTKHKVGSSKVAKIREEVERDIQRETQKSRESFVDEIMTHKGSAAGMTVTKIVGVPGAGKSVSTMRENLESPTDEQPSVEEKEEYEFDPIENASLEEIQAFAELGEQIHTFMERFEKVKNPTAFGQGIYYELKRFIKADQFVPYANAVLTVQE